MADLETLFFRSPPFLPPAPLPGFAAAAPAAGDDDESIGFLTNYHEIIFPFYSGFVAVYGLRNLSTQRRCIYIPSTATLAIRVLAKLTVQIVFLWFLIQRFVLNNDDGSTYVSLLNVGGGGGEPERKERYKTLELSQPLDSLQAFIFD